MLTIPVNIVRHSYAPHNLEQDVDIRFIQEWMGHESIKTTERIASAPKPMCGVKEVRR